LFHLDVTPCLVRDDLGTGEVACEPVVEPLRASAKLDGQAADGLAVHVGHALHSALAVAFNQGREDGDAAFLGQDVHGGPLAFSGRMAHARGADAWTGHRPGVLGSSVLVTPGGLFRRGVALQ
jgi:hypothetical protein